MRNERCEVLFITMDNAKIVNIAAVIADADVVFYEMVEAVEIQIGKHLTGEISDG